MHATFAYHTDPFRPSVHKDLSAIKPGIRIAKLLQSHNLYVKGKRTKAFIVCKNGKPLLQKQWKQRVRDTDVISVAILPRGGGGSNVLQIVAQIALIAASVYVPGLMGLEAGTFAFAATSAAIMIGGSLLLQMMFPPTQPSVGTLSREQASPTYSLTAQGNSARLMEAIPVLYGRHRIFPDFAGSPYSEIRGNDQYLYQLFCITQGSCTIEKIQIDDTDIANFSDVTYEIINPNQRLTLFPGNVVTNANVADLRMYGPNEPGYAVLGPFVINAAGTQVNNIGVDASLPNGAFRVDDQGNNIAVNVGVQFEYQLIDNSGAAIGPWTVFVSETITGNGNQPIRKGYKVAVPLGRYQVRGLRTNNAGTDSRTSDTLYWNTLRAYLEDSNQYGNVTMLAVSMKASNQLTQQNSRKINVIATRNLKTWEPVNGWSVSEMPTRSIAWALADAIKNNDYGRGLPDSRFNLDALYALDQTWATRGDTFNGVFDTTIQFWEALNKIAKAGRAMPMYYAGLIDFIRNEPKSLPTAMFQPQNMVAGSFNTTYQFPEIDTPDHVIVNYVNEQTWQQDSVKCVLAGGTENTPATIELFGVTNHDQAWREGITIAAVNRDQRRLINFTTEQDGLIPQYGDLVQVSHDVPAWGYSGRVLSFDRTAGVVEASEPFQFDPASPTHYIAFRKRDGSADGPYQIVAGADSYHAALVGTSQPQRDAIYISNGIQSDYTFFQFGPSGRDNIKLLCMGAQPSFDGQVALSFVNYAPSVFAAETGGILPPPNSPSNLPKPPVSPKIDSVVLEYTFVSGQQKIVAKPANGAQYYEFQASPDAGATWINFGNSVDPFLTVALNPGPWRIRVRGIGFAVGAWTTIDVTVTSQTLPLVSLSAFTASTDQVFQVGLNWIIASGSGGIAKSVEVWHNLSNNLGTAVKLGEFPVPVATYTQTNMGPGETHYYWARVIDTAGRQGPWFNSGIGIIGQSSSQAGKILDYLTGQITESQLYSTLLTKVNNGQAAYVQAGQTVTDLAAMYTIKTQLTVDGRTYMSGIGVGTVNNSGIIESQVLVAASRFAVLDPNTSSSARIPFIIQGGVVYIDTAFIQDGTITNAKIGNTIQSNAVNPSTGQPVWVLDKNGTFAMNGTGSDRTTIQSNVIKVISGGVTRVQIGDLSA